MAEQAVNTIYSLAEHPDVICGEMLHALFEKLLERLAVSSSPGDDSVELPLGAPLAESSQKGNILLHKSRVRLS